MRSRRSREVRGMTLRKIEVSQKQLEQMRRETGDLLADMPDIQRPVTRGDCIPGGRCYIRPCPFIGCRYHNYSCITRGCGLKLNFPDLEPWQIRHSCVLDVADEGEHTLEEVGDVMNITRERVRQLQASAFRKLVTLLPKPEET
jgi:hypothetical protein